ncbi:MAG: DUF4294 domain-containing protein [Bacteroidetes bacterium]|nr:MAG: DUF4294 domain-containing protein [Bacteroidota bacterium]RLD81293.1 MAG: DUF4294 domain-containing protein [Bacteroidota bacterium]
MMKHFLLSCILFLFLFPLLSQEEKKERIVVYATMLDGDTIPVIMLPELKIFSFKPYESKRQARKMTRLIKNVKRVYPYAMLAGIKLKEYEEILAGVEDKKVRKKIMKQAEDELDAEFGADLRDFTFSQGKILIKLVYRETGSSSYELVAELRGKFRAFFWQTFARIFGFNLKDGYDPEGEDKEIEFIVQMIEAGQL